MTEQRIDLRDRRIGRLSIMAGTTSKKLKRQYTDSLRILLDRGEYGLIDLLRKQKLHITEVHRAVTTGDYAPLNDRLAFSAGTIGAAVKKYLDILKTSREKRTWIARRSQTNALKGWFGADTTLETIDAAKAQTFLAGKEWSARTQRAAAHTYRRIWQLAGAKSNPWQVEGRNTPGLVLPRVRKQRHAFLLPARWTLYARSNQGLPELALGALGALAGLRAGEIAHLRLGVDVDLSRGVIHVQPRAGKYPWKPKTDNSVRDVPMSAELLAVLKDHVRLGFAGEYLIQLPGRDVPLNTVTLSRWFKAGLERAGLVYGREASGITMHSLRHTFASWLAQRDVQLLKIARLLGDTVEIVASYYAHLLPQDLDRAVTIIDDVVREAA